MVGPSSSQSGAQGPPAFQIRAASSVIHSCRYPGPFNDVDVFGGPFGTGAAALFAHQDAQAGSAQDDHRAGRVCDDVLAHRAKQHACEAPVSA